MISFYIGIDFFPCAFVLQIECKKKKNNFERNEKNTPPQEQGQLLYSAFRFPVKLPAENVEVKNTVRQIPITPLSVSHTHIHTHAEPLLLCSLQIFVPWNLFCQILLLCLCFWRSLPWPGVMMMMLTRLCSVIITLNPVQTPSPSLLFLRCLLSHLPPGLSKAAHWRRQATKWA